MAPPYQREHNELMLEFMKEKDVASMSGRLLNRWGRIKTATHGKIERLGQQAQISIPGLAKVTIQSHHLRVGLIMKP